MSQKCPYSEDTPLLFAVWAAGLPSFWKAVVRLTARARLGLALFDNHLARQGAPSSHVLVIHDEHHSAIGEPLTEPQRRGNGPPTKGRRTQARTHAVGGVSRRVQIGSRHP